MGTERRRFNWPGESAILVVLLSILACNVPLSVSDQGLLSETPSSPPIPTDPLLTVTATDTLTPTLTATMTASLTATPTRTPPPTLTPTYTIAFTPTNTPSATHTVVTPFVPPTNTNVPTNTSATATPLPAGAGTNLFANPGFEGIWRPVIFPEVNVFVDWQPFYCDEPYTPQKCPAERRDTQSPARQGFNEPNLLMGRPEFKPSDVSNRLHSGKTAQQWFCQFRTCRAGVFQTVSTTPGYNCEVTAWVQTWSAKTPYGTDGKPYTSDTATADDRANSTWFIKVDPGGGTYAFKDGILTSRAFTYDDGHFDKFAQIRFSFTAASSQATIFFENLRLWPFPFNDSYIDDASVRCVAP